ncbi:CLUMA_CG016603, isoform A [Clunio marinus]|uniref:CLUMA_CG016603, isoform A n=1 Tax=Clunio marinus TaxID=568069 RepID=A0A1J1IWY0_9DIPT|nr:CLUMA_CG016603, isoform A [Clunio marinus]
MDPFGILVADVHDLIFQHFNATDVIKSSLVSKLWFKTIGSSSECMQHIWLNIDNPSTQINVLERSARKYENFRIQPGSRAKLAKVINKFRPKIAMITDNHNEEIEHEDYVQFMMSMAPTIEQLHPGEASTTKPAKYKAINFPKLKELQLTVVDRSAFSIFLGSNPKLTKVLLSFSAEVLTEFLVPTNIIHDFLRENRQIESLWLCEIDCTFQSDLTQNIHLDLKTFAFGKTSSSFTDKVKANFVKFVKYQKSLEWLKVLCLQDIEVFLDLWSDGSFKKLFIMECSFKGAMCNRVLPINQTIEEINFYLNPSCHVLTFLRATPNLKSFKIRQLSKQILQFSIVNLPKLESIQFQSIEKGVTCFYKQLKTSTSDDMNLQINLEEMDFYEFVGRDATF